MQVIKNAKEWSGKAVQSVSQGAQLTAQKLAPVISWSQQTTQSVKESFNVAARKIDDTAKSYIVAIKRPRSTTTQMKYAAAGGGLAHLA